MAMKRRGVRRGGEVNSVKYPQLDATHWHTVSMQILFTLSSPPPFVSLHLSLSVSPSHHRDSRREPLSAPSSFALLFLSPVTSRGKRSDARRTCAHPVCTTHTHPLPPALCPPPLFHFAPYHGALSFRSLCQFRHSHLRVISETKSMLRINLLSNMTVIYYIAMMIYQ